VRPLRFLSVEPPAPSGIAVDRLAGARDQLVTYQVIVDDGIVVPVREGETVSIPVKAGPHRVRMQYHWLGSPELTVQVPEQGVVHLRCRSTAMGLASMFVRRKTYIELALADVELAPQRTLWGELKLRLLIFLSALLVSIFLILPILVTTGMRPSSAASVTATIVGASVWIPLFVRIPTRRRPKVSSHPEAPAR
jgi:hypothetical protein